MRQANKTQAAIFAPACPELPTDDDIRARAIWDNYSRWLVPRAVGAVVQRHNNLNAIAGILFPRTVWAYDVGEFDEDMFFLLTYAAAKWITVNAQRAERRRGINSGRRGSYFLRR